jgi:hypothetical protein
MTKYQKLEAVKVTVIKVVTAVMGLLFIVSLIN